MKKEQIAYMSRMTVVAEDQIKLLKKLGELHDDFRVTAFNHRGHFIGTGSDGIFLWDSKGRCYECSENEYSLTVPYLDEDGIPHFVEAMSTSRMKQLDIDYHYDCDGILQG